MKTRNGFQVYPLTVAQKFHLFYLPYCPNAAVLNIGTSLTIGTEVDFDVLREAIIRPTSAMRECVSVLRKMKMVLAINMW